MTGRRAIVGLCMLCCALLVSAFAAQSASAVTKGTTAFTCVLQAGGNLKGSHCLATGNGSDANHIPITESETTELTATNANTAFETTTARLWITKSTIAGTPVELQATGVSVTGSLVNAKAANGEHFTSGTLILTKTGVTVKKPEGKGCKVYTDTKNPVSGQFDEGEEGVVHSPELRFTTKEQGDFVKFEPVIGSALATYWITCTKGEGVPEALEGTWTINGSFKCPTDRATILCSHEEITTQNSVNGKGSKLGIDGALTLKAKKSTDGLFTPISTTTVETP